MKIEDAQVHKTLTIAAMAATLEAGDRAARAAVPHGDPRTERAREYADRAAELFSAVEHRVSQDGL